MRFPAIDRRVEMRSIGVRRRIAGTFCILSLAPAVHAAEPKIYLRTDISAAKIVETRNGYNVDVTLLASDFEEMFQRSRAELRGVDLAAPGILEIEIGRYIARRIEMRERGGTACASKIERSGEDPGNDEAVLISLTFECATKDVVYDARKFLAAHGPRAWQVVTIIRGDAHRQVMVNAESPPAPLNAPTDQAGAR